MADLHPFNTKVKISDTWVNPYNVDLFFYISWRPKVLLNFEIIINVLVRSFRFI